MNEIFKVEEYGYYTSIEDAVKAGKGSFRHIYKIILNKKDNYEEIFLKNQYYGNFHYYIYNNNTFYDPQDSVRLQEEIKKVEIQREELFQERKNMTYTQTPYLGWCDYPAQFAEKCPNYCGIVKFKKIVRKDSEYYQIREYQDFSSKHVDTYYPAIYIGNYDISHSNYVKFDYFDGKTPDNYNICYPKIDEIWEFETDRYPFGDFLYSPTTKIFVENGSYSELD
jgi:hypothetical protein